MPEKGGGARKHMAWAEILWHLTMHDAVDVTASAGCELAVRLRSMRSSRPSTATHMLRLLGGIGCDPELHDRQPGPRYGI